MSVFELHDVQAMRWIRDQGRDPQIDNADEIMDFIGRDRISGNYDPHLGDEAILFMTQISVVGVARLNAMDWVVINPQGEPMVLKHATFQALVTREIED